MNIRLGLQLKSIDSPDKKYRFTFDTLLKPFYISEMDVLQLFFDEYPFKYFKSVRELIFFNSIRADEIIGSKLGDISNQDILLLKKKLTLCLTIVSFGNKFNKDFITSLSRSKTFADFSVSTTSRSDPRFVVNIIKDAQECIDKIEDLIGIDTILTPAIGFTFVKGSNNPLNKSTPARLWHHGNLSVLSKEIIAFDKRYFKGIKYKNGAREDLE